MNPLRPPPSLPQTMTTGHSDSVTPSLAAGAAFAAATTKSRPQNQRVWFFHGNEKEVDDMDNGDSSMEGDDDEDELPFAVSSVPKHSASPLERSLLAPDAVTYTASTVHNPCLPSLSSTSMANINNPPSPHDCLSSSSHVLPGLAYSCSSMVSESSETVNQQLGNSRSNGSSSNTSSALTSRHTEAQDTTTYESCSSQEYGSKALTPRGVSAASAVATTNPIDTSANKVPATDAAGFSWLLEQADNSRSLMQPEITALPSPVHAINAVTSQLHSPLPPPLTDDCTGSYLILPEVDASFGASTHQLQRPPSRSAPPLSLQSLWPGGGGGDNQHSNSRMASVLAGASVVTTSSNSFTVTMDLFVPATSTTTTSMVGNSVQTSTLASPADDAASMMVEDVLDVLGNPDLLHFWCDALPVHSTTSSTLSPLVIVKSSEGARNAASATHVAQRWWWNRQQHSHSTMNNDPTAVTTTTPAAARLIQHRQYEGEWIEAVTATSLQPPQRSGHSRYRAVCYGASTCSSWSWAALAATWLGFPRFGQVSMFVERLAGQVSLTLGPFPDNVQVCHTFKVAPVMVRLPNSGSPMSKSGGSSYREIVKVRIVDSVRLLSHSDDTSDGMTGNIGGWCCGLWDTLGLNSCCCCSRTPALNDYIEQALSSMARLRFLVEQQETAALALSARDKVTPAMDANHHEGSAYSPLLV